MHILHITNNYSTNSLYSLLFVELKSFKYKQTVIAPIRMIEQQDNFNISDNFTQILYPFIIKRFWDRLFFRRKIRKTINYIEDNVNMHDIQVIHAHTLFSDGAVAYELSRKYNIPYIVAIRNTDINVFLKYMPFLKAYGLKIFENAQKVILISNTYLHHINKYYPNWLKTSSNKLEFVPNGINDFWLTNSKVKAKKCNNLYRLIFVGDFNANKNLALTIKAIQNLEKDYNITFEAIGMGRKNESPKYIGELQELIKKSSNIVLSNSLPKEILINKYSSSDIFIMVSHTETFGLVYAEALSQGLPLVYTKGEGIDDTFPDGFVGKAVYSRDINSIADGIKYVLDNYNNLIINISNLNIKRMFSWREIANTYKNIYDL